MVKNCAICNKEYKGWGDTCADCRKTKSAGGGTEQKTSGGDICHVWYNMSTKKGAAAGTEQKTSGGGGDICHVWYSNISITVTVTVTVIIMQ